MVHLSRPLSVNEYAMIINSIDALYWRDRSKALEAMCLAHRSFVPLCQKHMFSYFSYSPEKADTFLDIAEVSPHLANYIRTFTFEFNSKTSVANFPGSAKTLQFLDKLHNLSVLSIRSPEFRDSPGYDWKTLDPQVSKALLRLILSPNLESLDLHRFQNFPVEGLRQLKNAAHLKTLSIAALRIGRDVEPATDSTNADASNATSTATQLSKLSSFTGSESAMEVLMGRVGSRPHRPQVFDLTRMREFYTEWKGDREAKVSQLMIGSAPYLEDLFCVLPKDSTASYRGLAESILNGPFQTLRKLKLYTMKPTEDPDDPFHGSIRELARLAGKMQRLEDLSINFEHYTEDVDEVPLDLCETIKTKCRALDRIFANRNAFPSLRYVSIYLTISILDDPQFGILVLEQEFEAVARAVKQRSFPNLKAIPTINFNFNLEMEWTR